MHKLRLLFEYYKQATARGIINVYAHERTQNADERKANEICFTFVKHYNKCKERNKNEKELIKVY